jgi:predicted AAA+ superfamily ATPase
VKLQEIILEQRREMEEILGREKIVERKAKSLALSFLKYPNILAILGVRRCGKSILAFQLFSGQKFGYINFDDERLLGTKAEDLNRILQILYELYGKDLQNIVIDEPQNVEGWELFVNRLRRTKKVVVTGSNSKLLAGELATHLTKVHRH